MHTTLLAIQYFLILSLVFFLNSCTCRLAHSLYAHREMQNTSIYGQKWEKVLYLIMKGTSMESRFDNDYTEQVIITPALLELLRHIVDNHALALRSFIAQVQRTQKRISSDRRQNDDLENAQSSIIEFLTLMESLAHETSREQEATQQMQHVLMPSINRIDTSACDDDTVQASVEHATDQFSHNATQNPQELLFKELLKRWKPTKKTACH